MKLLLAALGLALASGAPASAQTTQPLSISLHGDGAQATKLPQYDPNSPIVVRVTDGGGQRIDDLTVIAAGPAGETIRSRLVRAGDGTFDGTLALSDEGAWRIHLASRTGSSRTDTTPVTLDVAAPPPSNAWIVGTAVGAAIFFLIGGSGFLLLRRAARTPPGFEPAG